jgi:hypothetical protein
MKVGDRVKPKVGDYEGISLTVIELLSRSRKKFVLLSNNRWYEEKDVKKV